MRCGRRGVNSVPRPREGDEARGDCGPVAMRAGGMGSGKRHAESGTARPAAQGRRWPLTVDVTRTSAQVGPGHQSSPVVSSPGSLGRRRPGTPRRGRRRRGVRRRSRAPPPSTPSGRLLTHSYVGTPSTGVRGCEHDTGGHHRTWRSAGVVRDVSDGGVAPW